MVHQNQHLTHELDIKKMISFRNTFTCSYYSQSPTGRTASLTATCPLFPRSPLITRIKHVWTFEILLLFLYNFKIYIVKLPYIIYLIYRAATFIIQRITKTRPVRPHQLISLSLYHIAELHKQNEDVKANNNNNK